MNTAPYLFFLIFHKTTLYFIDHYFKLISKGSCPDYRLKLDDIRCILGILRIYIRSVSWLKRETYVQVNICGGTMKSPDWYCINAGYAEFEFIKKSIPYLLYYSGISK